MDNDKKLGLKNYFQNEIKKKYHHDLLNDKFYDEVIFNKKSNGYYVEIGVLDGWQHSQTIHFEHVKEWDGIIVEPAIEWLDKIKELRDCNICTNPISDKREVNKFVVRDFLAYSHLIDIDEVYGPEDVKEVIEVETITLFDLFEKFNSPHEIDFVAIDTEGYELRILSKFFEENDKYKINLISFESGFYEKELNEILTNKSYVNIRNPYLDFIKVDVGGLGTLRMDLDNNFYNGDNILYDGDITKLSEVDWEYYYVHSDFLDKNPHLEKYIIR